MNILFLDLELNNNLDEGNSPKSKTTDIIQIGAVVLNLESGEVTKTFNRYCKLITPLDNGELRLSKFIIKLTRISQDKIDREAVSLVDAYCDLVDFCKENNVGRIAGTWGGGDLEGLREQVKFQSECDQGEYVDQELDLEKYETFHFKSPNLDSMTTYYMRKPPAWYFSKHSHTGFWDVKKIFQLYMYVNNKNSAGSLKKAMNVFKLTLPPNTSYHNAVTDAYATALVFKYLSNKLKDIPIPE